MLKVLFVCTGNICRSPMAEAVFQHLVNQAGLSDQFIVDSAGTEDWHAGEPAHSGTLNVLRQHHIPYHGRSRQITPSDFSTFDYILAMDRSHLNYLQRRAGSTTAQISLFLTPAYEAGLVSVQEVPDPYYNGHYSQTYELVSVGCAALLDYIRAEQGI